MIILDTSVLVSGLLSRKRDTPTSRLVRHVLAGEVSVLASAALLEEYARTASRVLEPTMTREELRDICVLLAFTATRLEPPAARAVCPDPKDRHLWALLEADLAAVLVTGEGALLLSSDFPGRVMRARDALERLGLESPPLGA